MFYQCSFSFARGMEQKQKCKGALLLQAWIEADDLYHISSSP